MSDFETFWAACPRKVGKSQARARFKGITQGGCEVRSKDKDGNIDKVWLEADAVDIVAGMKAYAAAYTGDPQFIPHPITWLNHGCWEDMEEEERGRYVEFYERGKQIDSTKNRGVSGHASAPVYSQLRCVK